MSQSSALLLLEEARRIDLKQEGSTFCLFDMRSCAHICVQICTDMYHPHKNPRKPFATLFIHAHKTVCMHKYKNTVKGASLWGKHQNLEGIWLVQADRNSQRFGLNL